MVQLVEVEITQQGADDRSLGCAGGWRPVLQAEYLTIAPDRLVDGTCENGPAGSRRGKKVRRVVGQRPSFLYELKRLRGQRDLVLKAVLRAPCRNRPHAGVEVEFFLGRSDYLAFALCGHERQAQYGLNLLGHVGFR